MNIGLFTDTYFPQISGVATSIKTLKNVLEAKGHSVYIFTTTDPKVDKDETEPNVFRFGSVPFVSFTDRRIAVRGLFHALEVAKELDLDIVHTQTEFSMGMIGKFVAKNLKIPCVHTYHTMYEDYLHYVLNGKLLKPAHVKQFTKMYLTHMTAVVAPSDRVLHTLKRYKIKIPISVIPTGIDLTRFSRPVSIDVRSQYGIGARHLLLSLSRIGQEKKLDVLIKAMPQILAVCPDAYLLIVGDGPAREDLEALVSEMGLQDFVGFAGEIDHEYVNDYYKSADLFVSASDSETQGLTFDEALAAGVKCVVYSEPYVNKLFDDPSVGATFNTPGEMVAEISQYLLHPAAFNDEIIRRQKLNEISADTFGNRILDFYHNAQSIFVASDDEPEEISDKEFLK
ncbi:glycosyltransferase family 4 protein [Agrilactobacillus fermenti]|uniref:glycosyltransferase family 4 protein n=1 Tax=Agrilactobacillus fermenti TaxID=2586909 RepID=UPI001E3721D1|nr:glycosyltransferase family 4 protein [Agrilactobacillus fermenti]MCD2257253.1 glycosyltransferase family 4 protein [Agrilactobacillus fermenti]